MRGFHGSLAFGQCQTIIPPHISQVKIFFFFLTFVVESVITYICTCTPGFLSGTASDCSQTVEGHNLGDFVYFQ